MMTMKLPANRRLRDLGTGRFLPRSWTATKYCAKCERDLPREMFNRKCSSSDGLQTDCKKCRAVINKEWAAKNPTRIKEAHRRYWAKNPDKRRALGRRSYRNHKAKYIFRAARWARANPEKVRLAQHKFKKLNRARIAAEGRAYAKSEKGMAARMRRTETLSRCYVHQLLVRDTRLPRDVIPIELVNVKRQHILLLRQLKEVTP